MKRLIPLIIPALALTACSPTTHELGYASENTIEIKYKDYAIGMVPCKCSTSWCSFVS